jgi:hypothetical protein
MIQNEEDVNCPFRAFLPPGKSSFIVPVPRMLCEKLSGIHINGLCFYALLSGRRYPRHFFVKIDMEAKVFPFC